MTQRSWIFALTISAALAHVAAAHASTFTVNSTADAVDASPGNGTCATAANVCTLRAAIQESNAHTGKDVIVLAATTYTLTRAGANEDASATGDLDINDDLDIKGQGPTQTIIDGGALDRVFDCDPGLQPFEHSVRISGLRIRNGSAYSGGGLQYACDLWLTDVSLRKNDAAAGGGITSETYWNQGAQLQMLRVEVRENTAYSGGGMYLDAPSPVTMRECEFRENTAQLSSGAIDALGSELTISDSFFYKNMASSFAAIFASVVNIDHSTFATNTSGSSAGTVLIAGSGEVTNSTFTDNWAPLGGALAVGGSGLAVANNLTFYDNEATDLSNTATTGASVSAVSNGSITIGNSLFETEFPNACSVYGTIISLGHNHLSDTSCNFSSAGDFVDAIVDVATTTLQDNGGPTLTFALDPYAQSVDNASTDTPGTTASSAETTDQRYVTRPIKGFAEATTAVADVGSYEKCIFATGPDSDGDGLRDACDPDDDDDGCYDAHDDRPLVSTRYAGIVVDGCDGRHAYYAYEGADPDNDGFLNCEDPDDDDDGVLDQDDACPEVATPTCVRPGKYLCYPSWVACLGGGCVENILKFYEVVNPAHQLRFERFEIWNETVYMTPIAGTTAAQSIAAIASNAPTARAQAMALTAAAPKAAAAPIRLTGRVRIEMWTRATATRPERLLSTLGEYDAGKARLGSLTTGNVIVLEPPADARSVLSTSTTWAAAATPAEVADTDDDGTPNVFDNCAFVSNRDQRDANLDGIGDACVVPPHAASAR